MKEKSDFLTKISYGTGKFIAELLTGGYGVLVYYFYETEQKLSVFYVSLATIIYSVWNAINDPLIGYLSEKNLFLSKKFGKRTPWIFIGLILCSLAFVFIFFIPENIASKDWSLFLWMVVSVCIYDFCYSMWELNYQGVFPNKFRNSKDRTSASSVSTFIGVFGIALGSLLPQKLSVNGVKSSYFTCAIVLGTIGIICSFLILKGVKETPEMRANYKAEYKAINKAGFFKTLTHTLKYKEFRVYLIMLLLYQSACICMTGSVKYVANGILGIKDATFISAFMLLGALVSVGVWKLVIKNFHYNNQKLLALTSFLMAGASLFMFFMNTEIGFALGMLLWGFGFGGFWTFMSPGMADVVDSIVVQEKRREDGVLMGVRAFFIRLSYAVQAFVFYLCHTLTKYDPVRAMPDENGLYRIQEPFARFGIKLHISIFPALFFLFAGLIILLAYPLTPKKIAENKMKLKELGL